MKKYSIIVALMIGLSLALLPIKNAHATVIDVFYYWGPNGDVAGTQESWVKAEEKFMSPPNVSFDITPFNTTDNQFRYDVMGGGSSPLNQTYNSFHVYSGPVLITGNTQDAGWVFHQDASGFWWDSTSSDYDGVARTFVIATTNPRGIVTGAADKNGTILANGHISGPVPEPSTLLLLGSGLTALGFLGRKVRKA